MSRYDTQKRDAGMTFWLMAFVTIAIVAGVMYAVHTGIMPNISTLMTQLKASTCSTNQQ